MPRAIDHIVIPAHDLEEQAELYGRLGFQVGPRNRHPWGTENHIIQFDGAFLELISLGPGYSPQDLMPKEFSFAGFVERYLAERQGLAMLVLRSRNAEADRVEFARLGLGDFSRFDFARQGRRPDGLPVNVAFSLAFAASTAWPQTGFFVCQQHYPENFWSRAAQYHPNGAYGLAAVRFRHPNPEEGRDFLRLFLDTPSVSVRDGYAFETESGRVQVLRDVSGDKPLMTELVFRVEDLTTCRRALQAGGVAYEETAEALVASMLGATLSFVEA